MRNRIVAFILAALTFCFAQPTTAGWFSKREEQPERPAAYNISVNPNADQEGLAQMNALQSQMEKDFEQIGELIKAGDTRSAMIKAQRALDKVMELVGVDSKAKLTKKFYVNMRFPEDATALDDLQEDQKTAVITRFRVFRGGYFLDILNLAKQTTLQYAQAMVARLLQSGQFTPEMRTKVIRDLTLAKLMPLPLVDNKDHTITVFLDEIANENHTVFFDLDIETYLKNDPNFALSTVELNQTLADIKRPFVPTEAKLARQQARELSYELAFQAGSSCMVPDRWGAKINFDEDRKMIGCFEDYYQKVGTYARCAELTRYMAAWRKTNPCCMRDNMEDERAKARIKCAQFYNGVK